MCPPKITSTLFEIRPEGFEPLIFWSVILRDIPVREMGLAVDYTNFLIESTCDYQRFAIDGTRLWQTYLEVLN